MSISLQRAIDESKGRTPRHCEWCGKEFDGTGRYCPEYCPECDWIPRPGDRDAAGTCAAKVTDVTPKG